MTIDKLLIIAVTALASVIGVLFKLYLSRNKEIATEQAAMIKEREGWSVERNKLAADLALERARMVADFELKEVELRADFEKRFRELIERYDGISRRDSENHRTHEDRVRKEFADMMEKVAAEAAKASSALVQMLQKFYDRMVGPRGGY
jgi:hypothetical protein